MSKLPADIKGRKEMLRKGGGVGKTDRTGVGGERSDIQCDLFVVIKSVPHHMFEL